MGFTHETRAAQLDKGKSYIYENLGDMTIIYQARRD